ncbi:MAG: hypothetical protein GEV08_24995, partial [Acidimicrobiia bacterium]|nr:hypothetical protein [Acidimicrobiia bacterium]
MRARSLPVVLMRGGTSKGVFVHLRDLPPPGPQRDAVVLDLMGSPDPMQIDGLGGTYSSTSKLVAVEPGNDGDDVRYWFAQVGVDTPVVDWSGNCGNLTTAVPAFALDEGLVAPAEPVTRLRMRNGNTGVAVEAEVAVHEGRASVEGEHVVAGVPRPGAPVVTRYLEPGGGVLGAELPSGRGRDLVATPFGTVEASLVDVTHPYAIVAASALGLVLEGAEPARLNQDAELVARLEQVRGSCAVLLDRAASWEEAASSSPVVPRLVLVEAGEGELGALAVSMGAVHRALPMTGALCLAGAVVLEGTVAAELGRDALAAGTVRIRHPRGTVEVLVERAAPVGTV